MPLQIPRADAMLLGKILSDMPQNQDQMMATPPVNPFAGLMPQQRQPMTVQPNQLQAIGIRG